MNHTILLLGAGKSASTLIRYLLDHSEKEGWQVTVGDISEELAKDKIQQHPNATGIAFDINNAAQRRLEIGKANLVISLLPPHLHILAAEECVALGKHMVTASYVSKEIMALDQQAKEKGIVLLNEMGLDPGIDHMSAMKLLDEIKKNGGIITSFKSYTGGLIAPESDDNPWHYKFTWNPRNVVLAGQGTAQYMEDGTLKHVPYSQLFTHLETIYVEGYGAFEGYPNRNSLSYRSSYGLEGIPTMLRGTLRNTGFCMAWNALIQLGLTDDSYKIADSHTLTYKKLLETLPGSKNIDPEVLPKLTWLGIFEEQLIPLQNASPAQILQQLLEQKWALKEGDIDMIVMQHQLEYVQDGQKRRVTSSLVVKGNNSIHTAMAKTVGLPLGIAAKLILNGKINLKGIQIPTGKEIYEPVLKELEEYQITFD